MPAYLGIGARFAGPVVHVIDGDGLCVAVGEGRQNWVEVRLADFYAPELSEAGGAAAKTRLERIALGKDAICVAGLRTYDRVAATCVIGGQRIGDALRAAGGREGGNGAGTVIGLPGGRASGVASGAMYRSCAAARAAGAAPMRRGQPGYNPDLDGDRDGIACEPYRARR